MLSVISTWIATLSLVFGGCCSNALTLEQITLGYPNAGSILTFFQFLVISLHGLPTFLRWSWLGPRLRPRRVPITRYLLQVGLFYCVSLLNNAAFAYRIPMAVHIIFRSAGLVISMILGWLVSKKKYSNLQIASVTLVTIGVILTTLSASQPKASSVSSDQLDLRTYLTGIGILTLALVLSGFLGLVQEATYTKYGQGSPKKSSQSSEEPPPSWQESMFYLHFLALPMFIPLLPDLATQMHNINSLGPRTNLNIPLPMPIPETASDTLPLGVLPPYSIPRLPLHFFPQSGNNSLISITQNVDSPTYPILALSIPQIYLPLAINTMTQLVCVAGVNRLTTRVSSLTVTLVLVVRKAVSLVISVIGIKQLYSISHDVCRPVIDDIAKTIKAHPWVQGLSLPTFEADVDSILRTLGFISKSNKPAQAVDLRMMWSGAALVLLGTIGYTLGNNNKKKKQKKE
ncbi:UAA transporter family-domain-containing protein [Panaeolus papilionaceus]|nr:UAA transporter family-domain-containing protein [Panaeolus papilionaceus]